MPQLRARMLSLSDEPSTGMTVAQVKAAKAEDAPHQQPVQHRSSLSVQIIHLR